MFSLIQNLFSTHEKERGKWGRQMHRELLWVVFVLTTCICSCLCHKRGAFRSFYQILECVCIYMICNTSEMHWTMQLASPWVLLLIFMMLRNMFTRDLQRACCKNRPLPHSSLPPHLLCSMLYLFRKKKKDSCKISLALFRRQLYFKFFQKGPWFQNNTTLQAQKWHLLFNISFFCFYPSLMFIVFRAKELLHL